MPGIRIIHLITASARAGLSQPGLGRGQGSFVASVSQFPHTVLPSFWRQDSIRYVFALRTNSHAYHTRGLQQKLFSSELESTMVNVRRNFRSVSPQKNELP